MTRLVNETRLLLVPGVNSDIIMNFRILQRLWKIIIIMMQKWHSKFSRSKIFTDAWRSTCTLVILLSLRDGCMEHINVLLAIKNMRNPGKSTKLKLLRLRGSDRCAHSITVEPLIKGARYSNRMWFLKLKNYRVRSCQKNSSHMESEVKHEYQIKRNSSLP